VGLLAQFSYLQVLDLLTTMAFLSVGVQEGNPVVRFALASADNLQALLIVKSVAIAIAFYCWQAKRYTVLHRANWFFAAIVAWNLVAFIIGSGQTS
jgi:hypothetical protein